MVLRVRKMFSFQIHVSPHLEWLFSFFFTLNPHDIKHPLSLIYLGSEGVLTERFSLDWDDEKMAEY